MATERKGLRHRSLERIRPIRETGDFYAGESFKIQRRFKRRKKMKMMMEEKERKKKGQI